MPYIKKKLRPYFDPMIEDIIDQIISGVGVNQIEEDDVAGIITYITFKLIRRFYQNGNWNRKMEAIKVCESAKAEFLRRFVYPHEDDAIKRNGDVE